MKPKIKPKVAKFLFSFIDSGNNSLATTAIIAPAANANKNGNTFLILNTNIAPITADTGSTNADATRVDRKSTRLNSSH